MIILTARRAIHRNRRRLILCAAVSVLAGGLWFWDTGHTVGGLPLSAVGAVGCGLGGTFFAVALLILTPMFRFALETTALSILGWALTLAVAPDLRVLAVTYPLPAVFTLFLTGCLNFRIFYGSWSDRLLQRRRQSERAVLVTPLPKEAAWNALVPTPDAEELFWDPTVEEITRVARDNERLQMVHRLENGARLERLIDVDQRKERSAFRADIHVPGARNGTQNPQTYTLLFSDEGDRTMVHVRIDRTDEPMRKALMRWIDDAAGRRFDRKLALVERDSSVSRQAVRRHGLA